MSRDLFFLRRLIFLCIFFTDNIRSVTAEMRMDAAKACAFVHCDPDENCINRKFWCKNPPCPSMVYCSKTPRESLKGPTTCSSARCSKGYICLVKVRGCRWDRGCSQRIARCVSEREYHDGAGSCTDFQCPSGHRCILKESLCAYPPCKLVKSCAKLEDVQSWHNGCRTLGCPSEYECFLRKPEDNCRVTKSCTNTPDCAITNVKEVPMHPDCRGWICPRHQECSALVPESCSSDYGVENCKVNRTCREPLAISVTTSTPYLRLIPRTPIDATNFRDGVWQEKNSEVAKDEEDTEDAECDLSTSTIRDNWGVELVKWNRRNGSIYRVPIYVRSIVNRKNISGAGAAFSKVRPTDNSVTKWLDHLRLKTGVDAINVWVKHAEENRKYEEFNEWLAAVNATLGHFRFEIWLREFQKLTSEYPAFQKWLAINDEKVIPLPEDRVRQGNHTEQKIFMGFLDQKPNMEVDSHEQVYETTENPVLRDFYPVDQETPNPRTSYEQNLEYKQHRNFNPPESKNEMLTSYIMNDFPNRVRTQQEKPDFKSGYFDSPELQTEGNESLQSDQKTINNSSVELPIQRKVSSNRDHSTIGSPENSPSNENYDAEVPRGLGNIGPETSEQIGNHSRINPDVLFDEVQVPERNFEPRRTPLVSIDLEQFIKEGRKEPSKPSESPESTERQFHQKVNEFDPKNSGSDIGMKNEKNVTKMYAVFAPAAEELRIISPWDSVRVLEPERKTYYTLMGFPQEKDNRMQIIGYPFVVSRVSSIDQDNIFSQSPRDLAQVPQEFESGNDQGRKHPAKSLNQILLRQNIPQTELRSNHEEQINRQSLSSDLRNPEDPISLPLENWYIWNARTPHHLPEVGHVSKMPINPYETGLTDLEESLKDYHDTLNSQEYVDAYVEAIIEDALSKVILGEELEGGPTNWKNWENPSPFSQDLYAATSTKRFEEGYRGDDVRVSQFPENMILRNILKNKKHDGDISKGAGNRAETISIPNSSNDSINTDIDYEYECEDWNEDFPQTMETEEISSVIGGSESDEVEEYYPEDEEQREYFEGSLKYGDQHLGVLETNLTDYNFRNYGNEEYEELSELES